MTAQPQPPIATAPIATAPIATAPIATAPIATTVTPPPFTAEAPPREVEPGDVHAETFRIDHLELLTAGECARTRDAVFALEPEWTRRDPERPFYTLGVAGYLDAAQQGAASYRRQASAVRGALEERFGWLYDRVSQALGAFLGHPCRYDERLSLPGFHVFLHHPEIGATTSGSVHFDLQADNFDWSGFAGADLDRQLSFTLAVRLPSVGGGLLVWDLNGKILHQLPEAERQRRLAAHRQPRLHPYAEGTLVVHSGQFLHQIARPKASQPGDERITFQGHAVYTDAAWILYW